MIIPATKAKESIESYNKRRREALLKLAREYFVNNQKQIEARFNNAVKKAHVYCDEGDKSFGHVYFYWPYEWRNVSYEFKYALGEVILEHVEPLGYSLSSYGVSDGISFTF